MSTIYVKTLALLKAALENHPELFAAVEYCHERSIRYGDIPKAFKVAIEDKDLFTASVAYLDLALGINYELDKE